MKKLGLCLCFLLLWSTAQAAPRISSIGGQFADDMPVSVSGSGFGSHSLDVEWLGGRNGHIEKGGTGATFGKAGWNILPYDNFFPTYDTSRAYSGSKSILFDSVRFGDGRIGISYDPGAPLADGYASWMARIETGGATGQWKMFRINWERNVVDTGPEMTVFNWFGQSDQVLLRRSVTDRDRYYPSGYPESGEWVRVEMFLKPSSSGGRADGNVEMWIHRPGKSIQKVLDANNAVTYLAGESKRWRYYIFQNYQGNGLGGSSRVWMDDIYIQNTRARIELGNAATWSACTQREIQNPTAWNDGFATFTLNQGAFRAGQQVYLYVIDANGNVNEQGTPLVLGTNGTVITPPTEPTPAPAPTEPAPAPAPTEPAPAPAPIEPAPAPVPAPTEPAPAPAPAPAPVPEPTEPVTKKPLPPKNLKIALK